MNLVIMGPPGAGKGTLAKDIVRLSGLMHVSTGDIFRSNIADDTELGRLASDYLHEGKLVPDNITNKMVAARLEANRDTGVLLDGYPRTLGQAAWLEDWMEHHEQLLAGVLLLDVADEVIIRRLSARLVCPNCGATYNSVTMPPKADNLCDRCGADLVVRPDDQPETVKARLDVYRQQTEPLTAWYQERGKLYRLKSGSTAEETAAQLPELLAELNLEIVTG